MCGLQERLEQEGAACGFTWQFRACVCFTGSRKMISVKKFCSYLVIAKKRIKRIMKAWKHTLGVKIARVLCKGISSQERMLRRTWYLKAATFPFPGCT